MKVDAVIKSKTLKTRKNIHTTEIETVLILQQMLVTQGKVISTIHEYISL